MFGLERGNNSFGTILIFAALALVFFAQKGSRKPMRTTVTGADKKEDEKTMGKEATTVLYSRSLGKAEKIQENEVLEGVDLKTDSEEKKEFNVLYSRSLGRASLKRQEKEVEISEQEKPESKTRVIFSRIIKRTVEEKRPHNVLYSRALGKRDKKGQEVVSNEERPEIQTKVHFSRIVKKAGQEEKPVSVLYSRSLASPRKE